MIINSRIIILISRILSDVSFNDLSSFDEVKNKNMMSILIIIMKMMISIMISIIIMMNQEIIRRAILMIVIFINIVDIKF